MSTATSRQLTLVGIRELRIACGLSIQQLRDRILEENPGMSVHRDTLYNIELGHRRGSVHLMNAWARALRMSPLDVHVVPESVIERTARAA